MWNSFDFIWFTSDFIWISFDLIWFSHAFVRNSCDFYDFHMILFGFHTIYMDFNMVLIWICQFLCFLPSAREFAFFFELQEFPDCLRMFRFPQVAANLPVATNFPNSKEISKVVFYSMWRRFSSDFGRILNVVLYDFIWVLYEFIWFLYVWERL